MKYEKENINRAVYELKECLTNILKAERKHYALRIRQLFLSIKNNDILDFIIRPYLELNLDMEKIGFIDAGHPRSDFIIPENEDEEIALILVVLKHMSENESSIEGGTYSLYTKKSYDEKFILV